MNTTNIKQKQHGIDKWKYIKILLLIVTSVILAAGVTTLPNVHAEDTTVSSSLKAPTNVTGTNVGSHIEIHWERSESNVDGYILYRKEGGSEWDDLAILSDADTTTYTDASVTAGITYYYRLTSYTDDGQNVSKYSSKLTLRHLLQPEDISVTSSTTGNTLTWTPQSAVTGYYIYRKAADEDTWTQAGSVTGKTIRSWTDTTASDGVLCQYCITSYYSTTSESDMSVPVSCMHLTKPSIISVARTSNKKMKVTWTSNESASGYQIQYSPARLFTSLKTLTVSGANTVSKTIGSLSKKYTYYVRIRSYKKTNGQTYYSAWTLYRASGGAKALSVSAVKKGSKTFELRAQAKQKLYQYDTVQGSCTDGTYGYFILYSRGVVKCRIAKVNLSTMKVVKVSGVLNIAHGNDMTYDSENKKLVIVHSTNNPKRLSVVNPSTLQVESSKDISIPSAIAGATDVQRKAICGFCGITYNASRRQYALLLSKSYNLLILNQNMEVVSYVTTTTKNPYVVQGMDSTDEYILIAQSPKYASQKNIVSIYNWEGQYLTKLDLKKGYEIESIFHVGTTFYASFYRSYYKTYYTKEKVTVVKNGKKKKKTVKIAHKKLMRSNYIYKITNL